MKQLLVANPPLAARCIAESGGERPGEATVQAVQQRLVELLTDPRVAIPATQRGRCGRQLPGRPAPGVGCAGWAARYRVGVRAREDPKTGRREFIYQEDERRTEPDFWMARYPITYRPVPGVPGCAGWFPQSHAGGKGWRRPRNTGRDAGEQWFKYWNHPRERVSWYDAIAFCRWLTAKARNIRTCCRKRCAAQKDWRITLPTEWQWEKAARGHDGRQYPWGKSIRGARIPARLRQHQRDI